MEKQIDHHRQCYLIEEFKTQRANFYRMRSLARNPTLARIIYSTFNSFQLFHPIWKRKRHKTLYRLLTSDLAWARCKNYYQLFNNHSCIIPRGIKKWQEEFPEIFVDWFNKFQNIYRFTRDNKLRQFCFRLLRELKLLRLADNDKCISFF